MKLSRLSRQTSNVFLVLILFWILALGSNSTAGASPVHAKERGEVSASPQNAPSVAMARKLGFARIGSHIDEEDGYEDILARDAPLSRP